MRLIRLSVGICCVAAATLSTFHVSAEEPLHIASVTIAKGPGAVANTVQRTTGASSSRVMTLDPLTAAETSAHSMVELAQPARRTPENFRQFAALNRGQIGDTQTLSLRFAAGTTLTQIKSTPDFKVEQGGSCVEGYSYVADSTCTLLVRSTPQGPGSRLGKLEISNSTDAVPLFVGLGGYGYAPTISFTPSIITTVPGTSGAISGSTSLAIDGGDTLYIADTGHNVVDSIDSSGVVVNATASFGATAPISVAVDRSGYVYFVQRSNPFLTILTGPYSETYYMTGSNSCAIGATCSLGNGPNFYTPNIDQLAIDPNGTVYMNYGSEAFELQNTNGVGGLNYIPLITAGSYNNTYYTSNLAYPLAVDSSENLYTYYNAGSNKQCAITAQPFYNAETNTFKLNTVTGTTNCGSSGDGGQSRGAEISNQVGQMTFDIAGNFYFTDTLNQKVRRIDNATGIITTIAGNGTKGNGGDNGPSTGAALNNPTGVTVDSQGQVYVLSNSATTGTAQSVRKVGVVGALNLGNMTVGSPSTAQTVTVANTGNSQLDFTHVGFSSGATSDFVIDPNTTSCNFTVALAAGRSCKIGFIFTPTATGARSAVLSITDDTIAGINTIQLTGAGFTAGTLNPANFSFASTNVGSSTGAQVATLTNTGKAVMAISSIAFSGTGATSYTDTTTCGTTLNVGASCTISVVFKPTAVGSLPATLTVSDNAITVHQAVALSGTGAGVAKAALTPTSLTFASTKVGATSASQTMKLSNTGTAALGLTSLKMAGTNAADFPLTQACGTSIAAGGSCSFTVSFKPTATGTRTGTVTAVTSVGTVTATTTGPSVAASVTPKVTLVSATKSATVSSTLVLTAHVVSNSATPSGNVQLMEGQRMVADGSLSNGVVTFNLTGLRRGLHMLQAVYMGDSSNAKTGSAMLAEWVNPSARIQPIGGPLPVLHPVNDTKPLEKSF
jgi:hypothetical protein